MKNIFPCFSRQNFIIGEYFIILLNIKYAIYKTSNIRIVSYNGRRH